MKQNEIEKNIGPSAPASPAATTFTPFVGELGGKPVLIWGQTSSGLARIKNPDYSHNPSAVPVSRIPAIRHLEVVEGKKSKYAVIKGGYLDLTTGQRVDNDIKAAIDKYRQAKASAPAPAPTPAPAPVAAAVTPAPVLVAWQHWTEFKDVRTRIYDDSLLEAITSSFDESTMATMRNDLCQAVLDAALCPSKEDLEEALEEFAKEVRGLWSRVEAITATSFTCSASPVAWFPLTEDLEVRLEGVGDTILWANVSECDLQAFDAGLFRVSLTKQRGLVVGIDRQDEIEIVVQMPLSIEENIDFVTNLVQEVFGYHPDQLTLF